MTKKTDALAKPGATNEAMAVAGNFDKADVRGKENITAKDVLLPFLAIAQKTSPQIDKSTDKYVPGLEYLDLFNSITNEKYEQPVTFIPLLLKKHAIEFNDFESGGGIKDRNVPWDDPRCQWNGDEKPVATQFYDWIVLLVPTMELIVLSMKSTNISVARRFQQIVNMRTGPAFAGQYTVTVNGEKNSFGSFGKLVIKPAGKPTDDEVAFAEEVYENIKDKNIETNHTADPEDQGGPAGDAAPPQSDDQVPY